MGAIGINNISTIQSNEQVDKMNDNIEKETKAVSKKKDVPTLPTYWGRSKATQEEKDYVQQKTESLKKAFKELNQWQKSHFGGDLELRYDGGYGAVQPFIAQFKITKSYGSSIPSATTIKAEVGKAFKDAGIPMNKVSVENILDDSGKYKPYFIVAFTPKKSDLKYDKKY